jgi:hypothetical protein
LCYLLQLKKDFKTIAGLTKITSNKYFDYFVVSFNSNKVSRAWDVSCFFAVVVVVSWGMDYLVFFGVYAYLIQKFKISSEAGASRPDKK